MVNFDYQPVNDPN